jgi:transcriptional regulator with XRE-family HTH domain
VKATLDALDKSQYWLEEQTGVGVSSLNKIIIGKSNPMLATAIKISQALKIDVHTLIRIGELPG